MISSYKLLGKFIKRQKHNVGIAKAVVDFAKFAAKLTPSKKDDKFVADLEKFVMKADKSVSKASSVKKEVDDVVKAVKKK
tara:strand:- start:17595 stop:17834 length:240 start_codon:yes stop_codon:yes gene_type:complete